LSSASLLHSRPVKLSSPSHTRHASTNKAEPATPTAALAYHIPTPDATGLLQSADYAKLYPPNRYAEPNSYVRFSDTVEEASGGWGGLGYCLDDEDLIWLRGFNAKAEGSSGGESSMGVALSPLRESRGDNSMPPPSLGRPSRGKGKEKEKEGPAPPVFISEDTFEYVMGVLEKHAEDAVPTLHTVR
jgi:enhancer of polycomb-like protein